MSTRGLRSTRSTKSISQTSKPSTISGQVCINRESRALLLRSGIENKRSKLESDEQGTTTTHSQNLVFQAQHSPPSPGNSYAAYPRGPYRSESPQSYRRTNDGPPGSDGTSPRDCSPLHGHRLFPTESDREEEVLGGAGQQILPSHVVPAYRAPPLLAHNVARRGPGSPHDNSVSYMTNVMHQSSSSSLRQEMLSTELVVSRPPEHRRSSVPERTHLAALQTFTQPFGFPAPDVKQGNTNRILPIPLPLAHTPAGSATTIRSLGPISPILHYSQPNVIGSLGEHDIRSPKSAIATLLEAGEQLNRHAECKAGSAMASFRTTEDNRLWENGS